MEQASIRAEDREAGLAEGRAEGRIEGDAKARQDIAAKLKREGLSTELIAKATGLSEEGIEN